MTQRLVLWLLTVAISMWLGSFIGKSLNSIPHITVYDGGRTVVERR